MGYIVHHGIVVTSWSREILDLAHAEALSIFGEFQVSPVVSAKVNDYRSFFVGPDGSKQGWEDDRKGNEEREQFVQWLCSQELEDGSSHLEWAEVQYGDENGQQKVIRASR